MQQNSSFKKKPKKPVKPKKPKVPVVPSTPTIIDTPVSTNPSGFNEKDDPLIAFVNASTLLSDQEVEIIQKACQKQVDEDYGPIWHLGMNSVFVPKGQSAPHGSWQIFFLDNPTISGALGYHDFQMGVPLAYVFISTSQKAGITPSSVASHEVLEMLSDPLINITAQVGSQTFYAYESCDAVQQSAYTVSVNIDGVSYPVKVSNFVTPDWFRTETNGPWDFLGKLSGPLELLPNGSYIGMWTPKTGWVQKNAFGEVKPISEDDMRYLGEGEKATVVMHSSSEPQRCLRPFQRRQMDKPFEVTSSWKMIVAMPENAQLLSQLTYETINDGEKISLRAFHPNHEQMLGEIIWNTKSSLFKKGEIRWLSVNDEFKRNGIATALFNKAQEIDSTVHHSNNLTEDGKEWFKSLTSLKVNEQPKSIKKLWLDDVRPAPEGWDHFTTAPEAIQALSSGGYTHISLDHDLGPEEAGTGYDVVKWLEEQHFTNPDFIMPEWRVHSANPVGRDRMEGVLRRLTSSIDMTQDKADNGELIIRTPGPSKIRQWMQHSAYPGGTTRMQHPTSGQDRMNINQLVT